MTAYLWQTVLEGFRGRFALPFLGLVVVLLGAGALLDLLDPSLDDLEILLDVGFVGTVVVAVPAAIALAVDLVGRFAEDGEGRAVVLRAGRVRAAAARLVGAALCAGLVGSVAGGLLWGTAVIAGPGGAPVATAPPLLGAEAALLALLAGAATLVLGRRAALPIALAFFVAGHVRLDSERLARLVPGTGGALLALAARLAPDLGVFDPFAGPAAIRAAETLLLYGGTYLAAGLLSARSRDI